MENRAPEHSLPAENDAPADSREQLLNRFIINQKQNAGIAPAPGPAPVAVTTPQRHDDAGAEPSPDNSLLSESLAKIFIRRQQYQRAFEIITQLSLNYPEKSIYFADQLRFLKKLIAISNHKEQTNH